MLRRSSASKMVSSKLLYKPCPVLLYTNNIRSSKPTSRYSPSSAQSPTTIQYYFPPYNKKPAVEPKNNSANTPTLFLVTASPAPLVEEAVEPLEVLEPVLEEPPVAVAVETTVPAPVVGTLPVAVALALVLHQTSPASEALMRHSARVPTVWS